MWTKENRRRYDRSALRYESDLTDDEWAEIAPMLPPARPGGNKRSVNLREVVNGLMYILSTGCQWRAIPKDLAPRSTVYDYFDRWQWDGTLPSIHHALYIKCREGAEREASPTAAIIDAQSVKSAEKVGAHIDPNGYDAGKKVKGKKRGSGANRLKDRAFRYYVAIATTCTFLVGALPVTIVICGVSGATGDGRAACHACITQQASRIGWDTDPARTAACTTEGGSDAYRRDDAVVRS